jgi:hypothetical protein
VPTYEKLPGFVRDHAGLTREEKRDFKRAVEKLVEDLKAGRPPRAGLRVGKLERYKDIWELTWAPDGKAAFSYGESIREGEPHIIWHAVGGHEIFDRLG